jgi:hypothetical protein
MFLDSCASTGSKAVLVPAFDAAIDRVIRCRFVPIPDYQTLMLPLLRVLGDTGDHTAGSVIDALATEFKLTPGKSARNAES